jgi:hypothetical protein
MALKACAMMVIFQKPTPSLIHHRRPTLYYPPLQNGWAAVMAGPLLPPAESFQRCFNEHFISFSSKLCNCTLRVYFFPPW